MPVEILIPSVVGLVVALLFLSLLTRRRPRHSPRLVRASLESAISVCQPQISPLPAPPKRLQRAQLEPQPTFTSELPLDIESTMPLGYTAAKAMRSQSRSAPLFVTAPATRKTKKTRVKNDVEQASSETKTEFVAKLEATSVMHSIALPAATVAPKPVAKADDETLVEVVATESGGAEIALTEAVAKNELVAHTPLDALDAPFGSSATSEAETTAEVEDTSEVETNSEVEDTPKFETTSEVEATSAVDATSEVEATPQVETSAELETTSEVESYDAPLTLEQAINPPVINQFVADATEPKRSEISVAAVPFFPTETTSTSSSLSGNSTVAVEASAEAFEADEAGQAQSITADSQEVSATATEPSTSAQRASIPVLVHRLPQEVCQRFTNLNQRLDRLEESIEALENQLQDFDLDFDSLTQLAGAEEDLNATEEPSKNGRIMAA